MRAFLLVCLIVSGCGAIRSQVGIDPGDQFVLGGNQRGAFSADLVNVGAVPIEVLEVTTEGDTLVIARLVPGVAARAQFQAGSAVLLVNRSGREAAVWATIRGDTALGMGYQAVD